MTTCHFCGIPHKTPCADEATAAQCPIRLARAARELQPKGPELPLNDETPTPAPAPLTPDHPLAQLADISANVAPAPALPPSPPPLPMQTPTQPLPVPPPVPLQAPGPAIDPDHYIRFKIQPIVFIRANELTYWQGNIIKYVCRADAKNGIEDIEKAISYLLKERAYLLDPASKWWDAQLPKGA